MNEIDNFISKIDEFYNYYPNLNYGYVYVSAALLSDLLYESDGITDFRIDAFVSGWESLALQTRHGQLFIKIELGLDYDDFVIHDLSGNRYSYKHHLLNEIIERTILRGNHE